MTNRWLTVILAAGLLATALAAAPFWTTKPYTQWTEKEVEKLLGNSPWVRSADVSIDFSNMPRGGPGGGGPSGVGRPGGGMDASTGTIGRPGSGLGGPGGGMGGGEMGGRQIPSAYVMWQSALPVRQAMVRAAQLRGSPAADELAKQLASESTHHILAVMGLQVGPGGGPGTMRRPNGGGQSAEGEALSAGQMPSAPQMEAMRERMQEQLKGTTTLTIDGAKIAPEKIETVVSGKERITLFYFPKEVNFTAKTKSMQFQTQMGPLKLLAKFKPKEMLD